MPYNAFNMKIKIEYNDDVHDDVHNCDYENEGEKFVFKTF
jgi:hypothetical protein